LNDATLFLTLVYKVLVWFASWWILNRRVI
jgi:hypothetical protein